jgi:3-oxoacyl-[acyl-carrier protein] reductase
MTKSVLVSGGSGGIGAALCRHLSKSGYRPIVGFAHGQGAAAAIAAECGGETLAMDLSNAAAVDNAIAALAKITPDLAGIVLAASPAPKVGPFARIASADLAEQWQVNVIGPQRLLAALIPAYFKRDRGGFIIGVLSNVMGDMGRTAMSGMGAYAIAKYAMAGMLAVVATDYPWIRVGSVSPSFTETAMLKAFDPRFLELVRARSPFRQPAEVASDIMALITPGAQP